MGEAFDVERDRAQVVAQCRVVAHLATALASVHSQKAKTFEDGAWPTILEMTGESTADLMEVLGNILNGMDAVDEAEDAWTHPIFERAQELFATPTNAPDRREEGL